MAKIENTTEHPFDVSGLPRDGKPGVLCNIPRATVAPDGTKTNGVGEIPDDVLAELLEKDPWAKAVFASGELVKAGGSVKAPVAGPGSAAHPGPVVPGSSAHPAPGPHPAPATFDEKAKK